MQYRVRSSIWFMCALGTLVLAFVVISTAVRARSPMEAGEPERSTATPSATALMVDLVPSYRRYESCVYQSISFEFFAVNDLPDPVSLTTTMRLTFQGGYNQDYVIPPFSGRESASNYVSCVGYQCPYFEFSLTADYYNEVAETNETNNTYGNIYAGLYPTYCPQNTPTWTSTSTVTSTATSTPTVTPTQCMMSFEDVLPSSTYYGYVRCLYCLGIVSGYSNGTFGVSNPVTRGQMTQFVSMSANFTDPASGQTFEDVPPGSTFYLFVERLALHEVIEGYPCGGPDEPCIQPDNRPYFRPGNNTSRGQLSKIVCRAFGCEGQPENQWFEDVPPGSNFYVDIESLYAFGAINGYSCGGPSEPCISPQNRPYFRPGNTSTRGQTAKIVAGIFYPNCDIPRR